MIYVTSDLHGSFKEFKELLKLINFNDDDYMYILGDVIDRGDEPIELIRYIMNSPNIELLMGNHEYMAMIILKLLIREIDNDKTADEVLTPDFYENYNIWVNYNGGITTLKQFIDLDNRELQKDIVDFLGSLPLYETLEIDDHLYILSHTFGYNNFNKDKDLDEYSIDDLLMDRVSYDKNYYNNDHIHIITGHTPTPLIREDGKPKILHINNHIDIDCGACFEGGALGCLKLDTMEEYYIKHIERQKRP